MSTAIAIFPRLFAVVVMMVPAVAWTGNAAMMERMTQELVELNGRVLEPVLDGVADGSYWLKAVILPEKRPGPFQFAIAAGDLATEGQETEMPGTIAIRQLDVPIMTNPTPPIWGSMLGAEAGDAVVPMPLPSAPAASPNRLIPIGGGRALSHW
jgi:hypothetical protein